MDVDQPRQIKTRRGHRGSGDKEKQEAAAAEAAAASPAADPEPDEFQNVDPTAVPGEDRLSPRGEAANSDTLGLASVARLGAPDNEMELHQRSTYGVRCNKHGMRTPARINGYSGFIIQMCRITYWSDPKMPYAHKAPGRSLF